MKQPQKMLCLDLFLSEITKADNSIAQSSDNECNTMLPLVSWDIFSDHYFKNLNASRKQLDLKKVKNYARKYHWKNNIEKLFESVDFSTIILTDINKKIIWVNEGFSTMTGYSRKEVLDKSPKILQGPKTSEQKKSALATHLNQDKPYSTTLINYRKNKSTYKCEVHIFPLFNHETTHFLALEKEVL